MVTSQFIKPPEQEYRKLKKRSMTQSPRSQHFHPYPSNRWFWEPEKEKVIRESSPQKEYSWKQSSQNLMSHIPYYQLVHPSRGELKHSGCNWVTGVPDWFVQRCQRGMNFDLKEIGEQQNDRNMIKLPQVDHNNCVLLKDPKSKEAQQIPLLSKSQIRKI